MPITTYALLIGGHENHIYKNGRHLVSGPPVVLEHMLKFIPSFTSNQTIRFHVVVVS